MDNETTNNVGGVAADRLRSIIERVERLRDKRKAMMADIRDVFMEAKSAGVDVRAIKQIIVPRRNRLRAENCALELAISGVEERLFTEMAYSRKLAEDRDALLAQNCRLRAQRDDALARRKRDEKGRFR